MFSLRSSNLGAGSKIERVILSTLYNMEKNVRIPSAFMTECVL